MTVYVDNWRERARTGRGRVAVWSHLRVGPGDALAELHAFATGIGLERRWFQDKTWPHAHYDVTDTVRRAAIAAGAVPVTWQQAGRQMLAARRRIALDKLTILEAGDRLLYPPTAVLDLTGAYRYELTRTWCSAPPVTWLMLNPSTADAVDDDQTIARCARRAQRIGAGGIVVVNLFAYRATRPADLARCPDPVGELNDEFIGQAIAEPGRLVIAGWGTHGTLHGRASQVTRMLAMAGVTTWCLGTTKNGQPVHPLYQPGNTKLIRYKPLVGCARA